MRPRVRRVPGNDWSRSVTGPLRVMALVWGVLWLLGLILRVAGWIVMQVLAALAWLLDRLRGIPSSKPLPPDVGSR